MSKYALGVFLLLYGVSVIIKTEIPMWVLGIVSIAAGLVCFGEGVKASK